MILEAQTMKELGNNKQNDKAALGQASKKKDLILKEYLWKREEESGIAQLLSCSQ